MKCTAVCSIAWSIQNGWNNVRSSIWEDIFKSSGGEEVRVHRRRYVMANKYMKIC